MIPTIYRKGITGKLAAMLMAGLVFFSTTGTTTLAASAEAAEAAQTAAEAQAIADTAAMQAAQIEAEAAAAQNRADTLGETAQTAAETIKAAQELYLQNSIDEDSLSVLQNAALAVVTDAGEAAEEAARVRAVADVAAADAAAAGKAAEKKQKAEAAATRKTQIMDSISEADVELLGALIFYEANTESYEGKVAVGNVVINRMLSTRFPDSMHAVIMQSGQFVPARLCGSLVARGRVPESCMQAARDAVAGSRPVGDAVFFCQARIAGGQILGAHCFYGTL